MEARGSRILLLTLLCISTSSCAQLQYISSDTCKNDHTCEYMYSVELSQFSGGPNDPITVTATVQIACESSGSYGSVAATRYCMTVEDVAGSFLTLGQNQANETFTRTMKQYLVDEYLSGWFCFVQSSEGQVVSVFHSRDEDVEAVNLKKSIAATFQANFRGTEQKIEIDPQSKHMSHYRYEDSPEGTTKMHRTITSEDVMEYPMHVSPRDVLLIKEADVEYRDGRLTKSNGTTHVSLDRFKFGDASSTPTDPEETNSIVDVFKVNGSFTMELKVCSLAPQSGRKRRSNAQQNLARDSSSEENLLASFDERKLDMETLENARKKLGNAESIIGGIRNINDTKTISMIEKVMILEHKYGPFKGHVPVRELVLDYLSEIASSVSEEVVSQRVMIYSLLSAEGSLRSQNTLIETYKSEITEGEKNSLIVAIASVTNPSNDFILELEQMITESADATHPLLLAYGALVSNAPPYMELQMVSFLTERLPEDQSDNRDIIIHLLNALGNTESQLAVEYIIQFVDSDDEDIELTAVIALRIFTNMPMVQDKLLYSMLSNPTEALVSVVIDALSEGLEYDREMMINEDVVAVLMNLTISFGNHDLEMELSLLFRMVGNSDTLALAQILDSKLIETSPSHQIRDTNNWPSSDPQYDVIASSSSRANDISTFPKYTSYLVSRQFGKTTDSYQVYLQATAGFFAGVNQNIDFKLFEKAVLRGHVFGNNYDAIKVEGSFQKLNGNIDGNLYGRIGTKVLFNPEIPANLSFTWSNSLINYRIKIFSFTYRIVVYGVPVNLGISSYINLEGSMDISVAPRGIGAQATLSFTPDATLIVQGTAAVGRVFFRIGASVDASIHYKIGVEANSTLCLHSGSLQSKVCGRIYDEWPGGNITLSVFYQYRRFCGLWSEQKSWDPASYTRSLPSSGGQNNRYNQCFGSVDC